MSMTVKRRKDDKLPRFFQHKVADIRGGVSVATSDLGGDYILEGAVLSVPNNGVCNVVKIAILTAAALATDTSYKVQKHHNFKVGQFVTNAVGAKAYAITAIDDSNKTYDVLTVGTTLGAALAIGDFLVEAAAESTDSSSALKYVPQSLSGTGKPFRAGDNVDTDAWLMGVTKGHPLPSCVSSKLAGIINY